MRFYEKSLRVGLWAVLCALVLRLVSMGLISKAADFMARPQTAAFLIYLETGRDVRSFASAGEELPDFMESPPPAALEPEPEPTEPEETAPEFSSEDAQTVRLYNTSGRKPDIEALLEEPLSISQEEGPLVLILSTHSTESYRKNGESYSETAAYRTLDADYNMLSLGRHVAELLEERGIPVLRDEQIHDYPSYNSAYSHARKSTKALLEENPSLRLILDLHRDAADSGNGQLRTCADVGGQDSAQIMLVAGTDGSGLSHKNWEHNLSLALKLQVQMERIAPGITRPVNLRAQRFNQDLSSGALIVEIGAAGNTHAEALLASEVLAEAVAELIEGSAS